MAPAEKASKPVGAGAATAAWRFRGTRAEGAPARGSPSTEMNSAPAANSIKPAAPTATGGFFNARVTGAKRSRRGTLTGGAPAAAARADWRFANMGRTGRSNRARENGLLQASPCRASVKKP